jgi:DNA-binding LacI/PurR family transcriptional regulator
MKPLPSITEVAELAGVSVATVSRVLNHTKPVNPDTRSRVEKAVAELGYHINAAGRSLAKAQSFNLLVLVPDFSNPFYAQIVQGVESVTRTRGYRIMLSDGSDGVAGVDSALASLNTRMVDGVISLEHLDEDAETIAQIRDLPWISCSEFLPGAGVPYVSIDHGQAAVDAVQYLLNKGHRRIALITADENYRWARLRREGYELALKRAGLPIDEGLVRTATSTDYEAGSQAASGLLTLFDPPTAVFAVSDTLAIGTVKALRRAGRRVPQDVAVVGFDDLPLSAVFEPALTTIAQPMRQLGAAAAEMLLARLGGERPHPRTLAHTLVIRDSA